VAAEAISMTNFFTPPKVFVLPCLAALVLVGALTGPIAKSSGASPPCTYYAATNGSDANPGSATAPFSTVQRLANALTPGQTGCLSSGTFAGDVSLSHGGQSAAPITITSTDPSTPATIKGRFLTLPGGDWWTFAQLRFDGTNSTNLPSPTIGSDHVTFSHDDITDNHTAICFDLINSSQWGTAHYTTIDSSRIHDCGRLPATNNDHGIYVSGYSTTITNNYIYDNADRGVQLRGSQNGAVNHNVIDGNGSGVIFGDLAANNNDVSRNIITNSVVRWNVESWWGTGAVGVGNVLHDNCTFSSNANTSYNANGGISGGNGYTTASNITANPGYVNRAAKDFRLPSGSPCVGYGPAAGIQPGIAVDTSTAPSDTTPPTTPSGLNATNLATSSLTLNWVAATDNVGISGYEIQRAGVKIGSSATTSFGVAGLTCGTAYAFAVAAVDAAGNRSTTSAPVTVSTSPCSTVGTFSTSLTGLSTLTLPFVWRFDPGVATAKGYFWVDGVNVASVTGPGPYSYSFNAGSLTPGVHTFGHAWDTTAGIHQTPASTYSLTVSAPLAVAPVNTVAPALSGTAALRSWVSTSNGLWTSSSPITFTYQWLRCDASGGNCAAIAGAVYSRYRPDATSKGYRLRAQVTAQNANGSSSALTPASNTL